MEYKYKKIPKATLTSSKDINSSFHAVSTDMYDMFVQTMTLASNVQADMLAANDTIGALINQVSVLSGLINNGNPNTVILTAFDTNGISYPTSKTATGWAYHLSEYGEFTLPVLEQTVQLININEETGEMTIRDDAKDYVTEYLSNNNYTDRIDSVFQNDVINSFDPAADSAFYLRTQASNPNVDYVDDIIQVTLPEAADINTIKIVPLPEYSINIHNVASTNVISSNATIKDNFGTDYEFPMISARRQVFHMQTRSTSEVTITLRQPDYNNINGSREFRLGARHISIENNVYANVGYVILKVPFNASYPDIRNIAMDWDADSNSKVYLYASLSNANAVNDSFVLQGTGSLIAPNIPLLTDGDCYLLVELRPIDATGATPVFRGCAVNRIA